MPSVRKEFPDFPLADLPAFPASFQDMSWHNDTCPSFLSEKLGLHVYVDYADPERREIPDCPRFTIYDWNEQDGCGDWHSTDDWNEIMACIALRAALSGR